MGGTLRGHLDKSQKFGFGGHAQHNEACEQTIGIERRDGFLQIDDRRVGYIWHLRMEDFQKPLLS